MIVVKKLKWLRPKELLKGKYWLHLVIIAVIVLGLLQLVYGGKMFTFWNIVLSIPLLAVGDVVAHTFLGID